LALAYFGTDQSQVGRYLSGDRFRESQMGHHERIIKSADAVLYFIDWCYGICFFSIQSRSFEFQSNNKAIEKISFKGEYNALEKKLDDLSMK
jgi:hypothetical protein